MRKRYTASSLWDEYIVFIKKYVPRAYAERVFTQKTMMIAAIVVVIEMLIALCVYVIWNRNP